MCLATFTLLHIKIGGGGGIPGTIPPYEALPTLLYALCRLHLSNMK